MQESELVELEIQTVLAAKKLEGRIMLFVPFGIVLFLRMTNASYMQVLYTTATGDFGWASRWRALVCARGGLKK